MRTVSLHTDRTFVRAVIARALVENIADRNEVEGLAVRRWGSAGALIARAAVGALTSADTGIDPARAWFDSVFESSILGRLQGLRRVPFAIRMTSMAGGSKGYWVGQLKPIPVSKQSLEGDSLQVMKVAALVVATLDSLRDGGQLGEEAVERDLRRAVVTALDAAFLDTGNTGIANELPPSVTSGGIVIPSVGDPGADVAAAIEAFEGDLTRAVWATDGKTAAAIGLSEAAVGGLRFPLAGARGGEVAGIPLVTTLGSPRDSSGGQLALIDPGTVAFAQEGGDVKRSTETMIVMSDDPEGDAPPVRVSMFQTESVAMKSTAYANWKAQQPGGVVTITGASYTATTSP